MALLLVKISDTHTLSMNEFFDYNGFCYAATYSRTSDSEEAIRQKEAIRLEEFYEATIETQIMKDIPVIFVVDEAPGTEVDEGTAKRTDMGADTVQKVRIIGWYKKADIFREIQNITLFLEGNVRAQASDVLLLPETPASAAGAGQSTGAANADILRVSWHAPGRLYEVIEEEDSRHDRLKKLIEKYAGANTFARYPYVRLELDPKALRSKERCLDICRELATQILADECPDIVGMKALEAYAKKACNLNRSDPDGYYYHALACYHLGFVKDGLKSVEKAIRLEPEAADLQALKGMLLVGRGYMPQGAEALHLAYERSKEEDYLLQEGRVWMICGQMEKAYECFKLITTEGMLDETGIKIGDMEKKWFFSNIRGRRLKNLWKRKK